MGLLGNSFTTNFGAGTAWGTVRAFSPGNRGKRQLFLQSYNIDGSATATSYNANPLGGYPSGTWQLARTEGQMSMRSFSEGDLTATLFADNPMEIDLTGSGSFSADLGSVISMLLGMIGNGDLTASIGGILNMDMDMVGSGDLSADMQGIANMVIEMLGSGDLEATIAGYGNMSIDMVVTGTGLSTSNVGQYVWQAILSEFSANPDSAAAKLLAAGSAGDPWSTNLPASYTGTQAGAIMDRIQTLVDELHKIEGLSLGNPMEVTQTNRTAGTINLDITGDGETQTIVTRND